MSKTPGSAEYVLSYSDMGGIAVLKGDLADAKRIQNTLFGTPRAGDRTFGMAMQDYLFEISDNETINELSQTATSKVNNYCPGVSLQALLIELRTAVEDPTGRGTNSVIVGITLGTKGSPLNMALVGQSSQIGLNISSIIL